MKTRSGKSSFLQNYNIGLPPFPTKVPHSTLQCDVIHYYTANCNYSQLQTTQSNYSTPTA